MDINQVRNNYLKLSDDELLRIVEERAKIVPPEVFDIMKTEIEKRKLNYRVLDRAVAERKEYSVEDLKSYSSLLRNLPCPVCNDNSAKLNGTISEIVTSYVLVTNISKKICIACPNCLDKQNNKGILLSSIFGWWGFPWGIIRTPGSIARNLKSKQQNHNSDPNEILLSFTLQNIGDIEINKDNPDRLIEIIRAKHQ